MRSAKGREVQDFNNALIRPEENKRMFDRTAKRYDLINKIISLGMDRYWRSKAIDLLEPVETGFYIDAGCGTGDIIMGIARRFPSACPRIIGIDQSAGMLEICKKKLDMLGSSRMIALIEGDALDLPVPDECADGIVSAFVFRNLDDRIGALKEWLRVLKPGGRCVILELSTPGNPVLRACNYLYARLFVPLAGALFSNAKDYQYLVKSIASFPSQKIVLEMVRKAGFSKADALPLSGGVVRMYLGVK